MSPKIPTSMSPPLRCVEKLGPGIECRRHATEAATAVVDALCTLATGDERGGSTSRCVMC